MTTLTYVKKKNPYIIPNINIPTSEILIDRRDKENEGAIQLVEVEVYVKWPSE